MSHCINIILINKKEIRESKISTILGKGKFLPEFVELPQSILAFPRLSKKDVCKHFGPDVEFIQVKTDYFGGIGEQSAGSYITTESGYTELSDISEFDISSPINHILREYGVQKDGGDEFDTIHLGRYRSNSDFLKEVKK